MYLQYGRVRENTIGGQRVGGVIGGQRREKLEAWSPLVGGIYNIDNVEQRKHLLWDKRKCPD